MLLHENYNWGDIFPCRGREKNIQVFGAKKLYMSVSSAVHNHAEYAILQKVMYFLMFMKTFECLSAFFTTALKWKRK